MQLSMGNERRIMITLFPPQERAKNEIVKDIATHLNSKSKDERRYGLTAPTGSGKTVILVKIIQEIAAQFDNKVAFIWLTIGRGDLTGQTISRLKRDLPGLPINSASDLSSNKNITGSITVINWDALNKTDKEGNQINVAMRDEDNFATICKTTRESNIPIILILDEVHIYANTEKSLTIRNEYINPTYTLEVSATPRTKRWHGSTKLSSKEISDCGLIKNEVKQKTFEKTKNGLRDGAKKLQQIIELAKETNVSYNPRMLVFIPSANQEEDMSVDEMLALFNEFGWTEENGDIVLWMSDRKSKNYERCKDNDSSCKVILTKEAIDTGVDIPSIQVIVQLRPAGNRRTEIQKLGRGLRMPEQKHYGNDLDKLFFYVFDDYEVDDTGAEYVLDLLEDKFKIVKDIRDFGRKTSIVMEKKMSNAYSKVVGFWSKKKDK